MALEASSIMTKNVCTVRPEATTAEVAQIMGDHRISAVPVVDADGKLLGMLSEGDLLRPFTRATRMRRDWWLGLLAEGSDLAPEFLDYIRSDQRLARDLMVTPVITAAPETNLTDMADLLTRRGIKRAPIVKDGKLLGIVSRADIVKALSKRH